MFAGVSVDSYDTIKKNKNCNWKDVLIFNILTVISITLLWGIMFSIVIIVTSITKPKPTIKTTTNSPCSTISYKIEVI